jgi:hypothetical protein
MIKLDLIATRKEVRSLSRLRGRAGEGVSPRATLPEWREPHPSLRVDLPGKRER